MQTFIFHIAGLHCASCVLLTESVLQEVPYVSQAKTDLRNESVEVVGDFGNKSPELVAAELTQVLSEHGYTLSVERRLSAKRWSEFARAVPIAVTGMLAFLLLQKAGLVRFIGTDESPYVTALVVGLVASVSTCMAVVGGLVLSMSAAFSKHGGTATSPIMFHAGRIVSFFVLGGVIGQAGAVFHVNETWSLVLSLIVGVAMCILGLHLLDIFGWTKKLQLSMPAFLSRRALRASQINHTLTPALVGAVTFFLPCGFTQSMQLYALSTGSFIRGGLTMLAFSLGTFPVLALMSFGLLGIEKSPHRGVFFKVVGLIVLAFSVFNVLNSLAAAGYILPIFFF